MNWRFSGGVRTVGLLAMLFLLSGCGFFAGAETEPTPAPAEIRALVPTFTPTSADQAPAPTNTPVVQEVAAAPATTMPVSDTMPISGTVAEAGAETPTPEPTATAAPQAKLIVAQDAVNVRLGPGTDYGLAGDASTGQTFDITGKNQAGDWWQFCCINGQQAWIFAQLVTTENADSVAVVTDLPPKPVVEAPPPQAAAPTATPEPVAEASPPPSDPCAGIGGDGCKFRLAEGPKFQPNGGTELKLQFFFIHSGDGGNPQGSYFVAMFKDGRKLPISDGTRSLVGVRQEGVLGAYNYEYKVGLGDIPGNNVAGNYSIYVLDGNGERDSQDFSFSVPDGQGEVWIKFDQG
jgi:hypothetical protein